MKQTIHAARVALLALITSISFAGSVFAKGYLALDTGYRSDRINQSFEFLDPADSGFYQSDQNNFQNLQGYILGAKGVWCFCCPILIKGEGHYTWLFGDRTNYNEQYLVKADASGHAVDASLGIGYVIPICNCFELVPLFGGSYDEHKLKVTGPKSKTSPDAVGPTEGARWKSEWYGPWGGLDIYFRDRCLCRPITYSVGYEFHYGWSDLHWKPPFSNSSVFNYKVHFDHMIGHVFHAQGLWCFCSNWIVGLNVQFTFWSNTHEKRQKILAPLDVIDFSPTEFVDASIVTWRSIRATVNLGYSF